MMKLEKLKGLLVEHKRTYADLAELLGVSITTINSKMNGKTQFDVVEATMISDWLELDCSSRVDIFLQNNLHITQVIDWKRWNLMKEIKEV